MAAVGLTRSTTIDVIEELVALGLLRELPNARAVGDYQKGRPARRFELRADAAVVVGIDVGPDHILTAVADLRGEILALEHTATDLDHDSPDERRAAATSAVDDALRAAGCTRDDVLALCAGVPAPVDSAGASPPHRNGFWRRMNPDLAELFGAWVPLVRVAERCLARGGRRGLGRRRGRPARFRHGAQRRVPRGRRRRGRKPAARRARRRRRDGGVRSCRRRRGCRGSRRPPRPVGAGGDRHRRRSRPTGRWPILAHAAADGSDGARPRPGRRPRCARGSSRGRAGCSASSRASSAACSTPGAWSCRAWRPTDAADLVEAARASLSLELDLPAPELVASKLGGDVVCIGAVSAALDAARAGVLDLGALWRDRAAVAAAPAASRS